MNCQQTLNVTNFILANSLKSSPELLFEIAEIMNIVSIVTLSLAAIFVLRKIFQQITSQANAINQKDLYNNLRALAFILIRLSYAVIVETLKAHHTAVLLSSFLIALPELALFFATLLKSAEAFFIALRPDSCEDKKERAKKYLKDSFKILGKAFFTLISVKNLLALVITGVDVATLGTMSFVLGIMYSSFYSLFVFSPKIYELLTGRLKIKQNLTELYTDLNTATSMMAEFVETTAHSACRYLKEQSGLAFNFFTSIYHELEQSSTRSLQPVFLFFDTEVKPLLEREIVPLITCTSFSFAQESAAQELSN